MTWSELEHCFPTSFFTLPIWLTCVGGWLETVALTTRESDSPPEARHSHRVRGRAPDHRERAIREIPESGRPDQTTPRDSSIDDDHPRSDSLLLRLRVRKREGSRESPRFARQSRTRCTTATRPRSRVAAVDEVVQTCGEPSHLPGDVGREVLDDHPVARLRGRAVAATNTTQTYAVTVNNRPYT